jgi:hypothetical protein
MSIEADILGEETAVSSEGLTDAERYYFESGGEATPELYDEYSSRPAPSREVHREVDEKVRTLADNIAQHERIARARMEGRLDAVQDAMREPQSLAQTEQQQEYRPKPTEDIIGWAERMERLADNLMRERADNERRVAEMQTYGTRVDEALSDQGVAQAWRAFELLEKARNLSAYYPQENHQQLLQRAIQNHGVPDQVHANWQRNAQAWCREKLDQGLDLASQIYFAAETRGYETARQVRAREKVQRQENARRAAQQRAEDAREDEWRDAVTRRVALPGETIESVLPNADDRRRYYSRSRYYRDHGAR